MFRSIPRSIRILGLTAALIGAGAGHGAFASRGSLPNAGPSAFPEAAVINTPAPTTATNASPAQVFLERSGATGSEGQHS